MENLNLQQPVYFRNEKVSLIMFETSFVSEDFNGVKEERILVQVGGAVLNVAYSELHN